MLKHVSASQIGDYKSCHRYWAFKKLTGQKPPESGSQSTGKQYHAALEAYSLTGALPDATAAADNGALLRDVVCKASTFLPAPGFGLVEWPIEFPTYKDGPDMVGYIDLAWPTGAMWSILDHKTTKDFRYAKSGAQLMFNDQMMIYAYWALHLSEMPWFPIPPEHRRRHAMHAETVELQHLYHLTKSPFHVRPVSVIVDRAHVDNYWATQIDPVVRDMVDTQERFTGDALAIPGDSTGRACKAYGGCHFRNVCPEANPNGGLITIQSLFGKEPPMSNESDILARKLAERMGKTAPTEAAPTAPPAPTPPPTAAQVVAASEAKRASLTAPDAPVPKRAAAKAPKAPPRAAAGPCRALYIDCRPVTGPDAEAAVPLAFETWMAALLKEAHTNLKVLHYKLVEYGKGPGALAALMEGRFDTLPEVVVVDSRHPEASLFLSIAVPRAGAVVSR